MKRPYSSSFIHVGFLILLAAVLYLGWWLAGNGEAMSAGPQLPSLAVNKGPVSPTFCAPSVPRPPPEIDTPFGLHLYAARARGIIYALPAMIIADQLAPPAGPEAKPAAPPATESGETAPRKNETAYDDVQSVQNLLEEYCRNFGAMPVGELNDEIVRRLQGENPRGIAVLPKTHPSINSDGELVDRWGTPYRFHPESAWRTTIRSAGPDRKMWTPDDILSDADGKSDIQL
jgi:hypothetical protein